MKPKQKTLIGKCHDCGKRRKLYTIDFDIDINIKPRCNKCIRELQLRTWIEMYKVDLEYKKRFNKN